MIFLANSTDDNLVMFFVLFFPENRIRYIIQIVSNLHEMSNPIFWGK